MVDDLLHATQVGDITCLRECLEAGTHPDGDLFGTRAGQWTPLHHAASKGHVDCLAALIKAGGNVNAQTKDGSTPLHLAAGGPGQTECVDLLLKAGADCTATEEDGVTPLHDACRRGNTRCAMLLMEAGADSHAKCDDGTTPLKLTIDCYQHETRAAVRDFRVRWRLPPCLWRQAVEAKRDAGLVFKAAAEGRPMELEKRLRLGKLAGGLDIEDDVKEDGHSARQVGPLEAARLGGHEDCVKLLEEAISGRASGLREGGQRGDHGVVCLEINEYGGST